MFYLAEMSSTTKTEKSPEFFSPPYLNDITNAWMMTMEAKVAPNHCENKKRINI